MLGGGVKNFHTILQLICENRGLFNKFEKKCNFRPNFPIFGWIFFGGEGLRLRIFSGGRVKANPPPPPLKSCMWEWVSTAQNLIARQSIGQHFWQEINWLTQNFSTARIKLNWAQPDWTSWQKSEMVNNFICCTCSWPNLPYLTLPYLT